MNNVDWQRVTAALGFPVILADEYLRIYWQNPEATDCFGVLEGKLFDSLLDAVVPQQKQECLRKTAELLNLAPNESRRFSPLAVRTPNINLCIAEVTATRLPDDGPDCNGFVLLIRDITQELVHQNELQLSAKVFECSGEAILITDPLDRILAANEAFGRMTGYDEANILGQHPDFLRRDIIEDGIYDSMWSDVREHGHWKGEVHHRRPSGEVYPVWLAVTAVRDNTAEISHFISIFSDITERKAREEHIRHLAEHDYLTGLPNRVLLQDRFSQSVARLRRSKSSSMALLFIDLDGFKQINDEAGHSVGDEVLQVIAHRLEGVLRKTDSVCRYGGDEFVLLLPSLTREAVADPFISKIMQQLSADIFIKGETYRVGASIGAAFYPRHGETLDALLENADKAMYEVKQQGKNNWKIHN